MPSPTNPARIPGPHIPSHATETITQLDDQGLKLASEFRLDGVIVGRASFFPNGNAAFAVGLRRGKQVGFAIEFHEEPPGAVSHAEPFVSGRLHGLARQYDVNGTLLMISPFTRGNGTDFWCDQDGHLAEEHPLVDGVISGVDRWWMRDGECIYEETNYRAGLKHGPHRSWNQGKLKRGYPHFFIDGERVSTRVYLLRARVDPKMPAYRSDDDQPQRLLPLSFIELKKKAARLAVSEPTPRRWVHG